MSENLYHSDSEVDALIKVGVRLGAKYVRHIQHIERLNKLEEAVKHALKLSKTMGDTEARKDAQELAKKLDYHRTQKTPDFGAETMDFVRAVAPWMPECPPPEPSELEKKYS